MWFDGTADTVEGPWIGKLYAINYQSEKEIELQNKLIEEDRNSLYETLRDFNWHHGRGSDPKHFAGDPVHGHRRRHRRAAEY